MPNKPISTNKKYDIKQKSNTQSSKYQANVPKILIFTSILILIQFLVGTKTIVSCKKVVLFEDDFSNTKNFHKLQKIRGKAKIEKIMGLGGHKHFLKYGGYRRHLKIRPGHHGKVSFIETELDLSDYKTPPHLRIKINLTKKAFCDNHYLILRSESLTADIPGQHPGVSMQTAGMGNVGGINSNTGQLVFAGQRCDEKVLHTRKEDLQTLCADYTNCPIDITINTTTVIFKDECGCKTLEVKHSIYHKRKNLHLILGAHTVIGAMHGAIFHSVKVYTVEPEEDDEELKEIDPSELGPGYSYEDLHSFYSNKGYVDKEKQESLRHKRAYMKMIETEMRESGEL